MKNKKYFINILLLFLFGFFNIFGENFKNLDISEIYTEKVKKLNQKIKPGKQYLLLIGIDKYQNRLPLNIHVNNAKEIRNILYKKYYINEITELYNENATKENIIRTINKLSRKLNFNDSVVIFYGGHGYIDPKTNKGYWIPYDGGINEIVKEKWIPNEDIRNLVSFFPAYHVLLICDSSFSNNLINPIDSSSLDYNEEYFKNIIKYKSRQILSSGVPESESFESEFIIRFKSFINNYNKSYLDPDTIYNNIKLNIKPVPFFGELKSTGNVKGSSFIFYKRENDPVDNEYLVKLDKKEKLENNIKSNNEKTNDSTKEEKNEKSSKNETELSVKEEELKRREDQIKKKEDDILASVYAKITNKVGLSLCPLGVSLTLSGIIILAVDLGFYSKELENSRNQLKDGSIQYSQYEKIYNNYIGLIIAGSALSAVGLIFVTVSIPLMLYKKSFKPIKILSLDFNLSDNSSIYLSYKF